MILFSLVATLMAMLVCAAVAVICSLLMQVFALRQLGEDPEADRSARRTLWQWPLFSAVGVGVWSATSMLLDCLWPGAPEPCTLVFSLLCASLALATLERAVVRWTSTPHSTIPWRLVGVGFLCLSLVWALHRGLPHWIAAWAGFAIVLPLVWAPGMMSAAALRRGDYDRALWWARFYTGLPATKAEILLAMGRPKEAEEDILSGARTLMLSRDRFALTLLARALMDQNRFEEARGKLDLASKRTPRDPAIPALLAEWYLRQNREPEQALAVIEQALARSPKAQAGERWSIKAWALAQLGRREEAEHAIQQALALADRKHIPMLARIEQRIEAAKAYRFCP